MASKKDSNDACPYEGLTATDVTCPLCRNGKLVPARGRFGPVYKCGADVRPKCKFQLTSRPTGRVCAYLRDNGEPCGALMVDAPKPYP